MQTDKSYWNPYLAGIGLGLTLILSYLVLGTGLGASGGIARLAAQAAHTIVPAQVESNPTLAAWFQDGSALRYYLVFMFLGTFGGGLLSALSARRIEPGIERGAHASITLRLGLALLGGLLSGLGARFAMGCTSGQALSGGAMLQLGSFVFLGATFAAGYGLAPLVRKEWRS